MSTFENSMSVTQTAKEYLAERLQKEKLKQINFAANTGKTDLIIPLKVKEEFRAQFRCHQRFSPDLDLVDLAWLAKSYLGKAAKSFPLVDRETCVAVLLCAIAYNQMPVLPRLKALHEPEGRRFRAA
jgi:hypothetical protein